MDHRRWPDFLQDENHLPLVITIGFSPIDQFVNNGTNVTVNDSMTMLFSLTKSKSKNCILEVRICKWNPNAHNVLLWNSIDFEACTYSKNELSTKTNTSREENFHIHLWATDYRGLRNKLSLPIVYDFLNQNQSQNN